MTTTQQDRARLFHDLHTPSAPLALANAWDVASARVAEEAGAPAVATTSAGVAWSLGEPDGDRLGRDRVAEVVARIAGAVAVPVSADIEGGYADSADGVARTVTAVTGAGAVGVNIEDADPGGPAPLRPVAEQCARIAAARKAADRAGVALFVNARTDVYLSAVGEPGGRLADALARAAAYRDAGADGVFVPGVIDPVTVAALAKGIEAPLNVLVGPGAPGVAELGGLGVARVSLGAAVVLSAYARVRSAVRELLATGTYSSLDTGLGYGEVNGLLER